MAWLGKRGGDAAMSVETVAQAESPVGPELAAPRAVVFQPEPLGEDAGGVVATRGSRPATDGAPELEWTIPTRPARTTELPRTPLQEQMAKIAKKHKDGPIEDMVAPIRKALAARGHEIPDEWILAIAEGLRQHGPIQLNLDGPRRAPR